ncbi:MAG TPA: hypothetical protein VGR28_10190 [Candidatus Thermoplasmatota archaeon]|jgi:hypothetical protein|nr:hypothetical protein [Candidatus Thermoplasmatota archaeon]
MRASMLAAVAAFALLAPAAAADPIGGSVENPACGLVPAPCGDPYIQADPDALLACVVLGDPTTVCLAFTCTLDSPPSRCGTGWLAFGFA